MVVRPSPHGDFHYLVVTRRRTGKERVHEFASEAQLEPGDVLRLDGLWLVASIEAGQDAPARAVAVPARYRLRLRHPDGREELGGLAPLPARPSPARPFVHDSRRRAARHLGGRRSAAGAGRAGRAVPRLHRRARLRGGRGAPEPRARAHARPQPGERASPVRPGRVREGGADWSVDRAGRTRARRGA